MKILLEISYLGSNFAGYQVQPGKLTVQSALQDAIEAVYGERYPVKGCSRTDAGVHARRYYATFETDKQIPTDRIPAALNSLIAEGISVNSAAAVPEGFHVRHDVVMKEYEYLILNSHTPDPFLTGRVWHFPKPLLPDSTQRMQAAADAFTGKRDFAAFMSAGSDVCDTVRDLKYIKVEREGDIISIRVAADGFLYNMVRIIVGTLLEVGLGKKQPEDIPAVIASLDRKNAGITAPPEGLYLNTVEFREDSLK